LFNIKLDYQQENPVIDSKIEGKYENLLAMALKNYDAPDEQFERLGLKKPSVSLDKGYDLHSHI
jgi:hypothetical protein